VDLVVSSLGVDGLSDTAPGAGAEPYELDFPFAASPPLIADSHYRIMITDSRTAAAGDATDGLRVDFGAPASCWMGTCSNSTFTTEADCVLNGAIWTLVKPRADITNSTDCLTQHGAWQPSQNLCMAMRVIQNGVLVQHVSYGATLIQWDGTQKVVEFIFEDTTSPTLTEDTYLFQGQMAWGVFEYDSATIPPACNTNKPFPAGSDPWKNFTYVPGNTLLPFERTINP
jgi:hypothetical protein